MLFQSNSGMPRLVLVRAWRLFFCLLFTACSVFRVIRPNEPAVCVDKSTAAPDVLSERWRLERGGIERQKPCSHFRQLARVLLCEVVILTRVFVKLEKASVTAIKRHFFSGLVRGGVGVHRSLPESLAINMSRRPTLTSDPLTRSSACPQ